MIAPWLLTSRDSLLCLSSLTKKMFKRKNHSSFVVKVNQIQVCYAEYLPRYDGIVKQQASVSSSADNCVRTSPTDTVISWWVDWSNSISGILTAVTGVTMRSQAHQRVFHVVKVTPANEYWPGLCVFMCHALFWWNKLCGIYNWA